jgi:hypothetical protein
MSDMNSTVKLGEQSLVKDERHELHRQTMSLIFYQTLFTLFDGGVHVAHLLPDSVHSV